MGTPAVQQPPPSRVFVPAVDLTAAPIPVTVSSVTGSSGLLFQGTGLIIAITAAESTGSAGARYKLHDGQDSTGQLIAALAAPANGFAPVAPAGPGIYFKDGIYVEAVSGAMNLTVTYLPLLSPL